MISPELKDQVNLIMTRHQVSAASGWDQINKFLKDAGVSYQRPPQSSWESVLPTALGSSPMWGGPTT